MLLTPRDYFSFGLIALCWCGQHLTRGGIFGLLKDKRCSGIRYCFKACDEYGEQKVGFQKLEERLGLAVLLGGQLVCPSVYMLVGHRPSILLNSQNQMEMEVGLIKTLGRASLGLY